MSEKILVPALGESVTEATVSKWLKNKGDKIVSDEPLVELETDKVNVEVPAPTNGTLEDISVGEGQTVNVGAVLGTIGAANLKVKKEIVEEKKYTPPLKKEIVEEKKYTPPLKKDNKTQDAPLVLHEEEKEEALILDNELSLNKTIENKNDQIAFNYC